MEGGGTLIINSNITTQLNNGFDVGLNKTTFNGICQINAGGFFSNSPIYGPSSTLIYNTGTVYGRSAEWNATSGAGYPNAVQISNSTTLNYPNTGGGAFSTNLVIAKNLTIDSGSSLFMGFGDNGNKSGSLTVGGDLLNNGNLGLGNATGGDLRLGGNFASNGTFIANNRRVFFIKNGLQTISSTNTNPLLTLPYVVLQAASGNPVVQLNCDLVISAPLGGNAILFDSPTSANDVIDLFGKTLTIGTNGLNNTIGGSGTFKGSTSSNLTLLGSGSLGFLRFSSDLSLGTLTLDKVSNTIGFELGTNLTVASNLNLTNGIVDAGLNELIIGAAASITGASSQNFILATSGRLRKNFNAAGGFTFPIGTSIGSYSPATINFTTLTANGSIAMNVFPSRQTNVPLTPGHYINRYWNVIGTGIASDNYSFTGTYLNGDIVGTEANMFALRRNTTSGTWLSGATVNATANTFTLTGMSTATSPIASIYEYTAGTTPAITMTPTTLTGFTYVYGSGPSAPQQFSVSGSNLTANITLTAPTNYEISLASGSGYASSIVLAQAGGTVTSTPIFVRLRTGRVVANYNENVTAESALATNATVALTGNVTPKALTVANAVAQNKPYDANTTATITGATLVGVVGSDAVTVSGGGTFADPNVGTGISVTANLTLGGANAGNYTITQPTGLSANITAVAPNLTASTISIAVGGTYTLPGANVTTNSSGALSYTLGTVSPAGSVTLTGGNVLNGVAIGTAQVTINQAANGNYTAGSTVVTVNVVTVVFTVGDYRTNANFTGNIFFNSTNPSSGIYPWQTWNGSSWVDVTGSSASSAPQNLLTKPENIFIVGESFVDLAAGGVYNNIFLDNPNAVLFSGATATGLQIAAGKTLDIKAGYFTLEGRFLLNANANVIVRTGAVFDIYSSSSNFTRNSTSNLTVEDNGELYIDNYLANIWTGNENFAGESYVGVYGWDRNERFFNAATDISNNSVGSKFGYLDIDIASGAISGNWTFVFPAENFTLTNKDFFLTNNDSDNITLNPGTMEIGGDFIIYGTGNIQGRGQPGSKIFNVRGNFVKNGTGAFRLNTSVDTANPVELNVDGNFTVNQGFFVIDNNSTTNLSSRVNLKGNLFKATSSSMTNLNTNSQNVTFNFTGNSLQTVNLNVGASDDMLRYNFYVKNGAYVSPTIQDWKLATDSKIIVESGGTLDFAFNGATALNVITNGSQSGMTFNAQSGSTLKITSPFGITTAAASATSGNVQTPVSGRTFNAGATYHYIGKANQVSGNGLPNAMTAKVIVELDTDALTFNVSGNRTFTAAGTLEIRKGIVIDDSTNSFNTNGSQLGNLTMSGGRYRISKTTTQPPFSGTYTLTAGVVEFNNNSLSTSQSIRSPKSYQNIEVTGRNVDNSGSGNVLVSPISLNDNGTFTITSAGKFMSSNGLNPIDGGSSGTQTLTVKTGGIFVTAVTPGFYGSATAEPYESVQNSIENVILEQGSYVEYGRKEGVDFTGIPFGATSGNQTITTLAGIVENTSDPGDDDSHYSNLKLSGSGTKSFAGTSLKVGNELDVEGTALVPVLETQTLVVNKKIATVDVNTVINTAPNTSVDATVGILIKDSGSLVQIENPVTNVNTGNIQMERITKPVFRFDYTYWSSPVENFKLKAVSPATLFDKFFSWNQAATPQAWLMHSMHTTLGNPNYLMEEGRGYIVRAPQGFFTEVPLTGPAQEYTANFVGKPNNGTVTVPVFGSDSALTADNKWNLLGNPYPSAIDATTFLNANTNLGGTLYFWTHNTSISSASPSYAPNDYASWNGTGATATLAGADGVINNNAPTGKIAAGQGFFVKGIVDGAGIATFNNTMRVREAGQNNQFFKGFIAEEHTANTTPSEKHRVWLNIKGTPKGFNQLLVGYIENATNDYDNRFDGESFGGNLVTFYSINNTKNLVIQGRALPFLATDTVPLGYRTTLTGNLTISIDHVDGLMEDQDIYLQDNVLNVVHDLKASNYTFATVPGTFNSRFVLRYLPQEDLSNPSFDDQLKAVRIYKNEATLYVSSPYETIATVAVYDLTGRLVFERKNCNTNRFETTELLSVDQALIVKVTLINGAVVSEKVAP